MSILHVAFYPSDWLAGTRGLTDAETGVYITLIARMYEMAGAIPRDDERLSRLCGSKSKASFVKSLNQLIFEGKIIDRDGELFNDRVEKEIKNTIEKSDKAKDAAKSRWSKKANKNNGRTNAVASPKHMPKTCQLEPELDKKIETKVSTKKGSRISDDWVPDFGESDKIGLSREVAQHEADKFKDYWKSKTGKDAAKMDWAATWRNWCRNAQPPPRGSPPAKQSTSTKGALDKILGNANENLSRNQDGIKIIEH